MIVCHCKGVNDRTIRQVVREGARSRRQVARACAAGRSCGGCRPTIDEIIASENTDASAEPLALAELVPAS